MRYLYQSTPPPREDNLFHSKCPGSIFFSPGISVNNQTEDRNVSTQEGDGKQWEEVKQELVETSKELEKKNHRNKAKLEETEIKSTL